MRLAIADPPYLGRANRWYGTGRGSGRNVTGGRPARKPDFHPDAAKWDDPAEHVALVERLAADYDGWAVAGTSDSASLLLSAAPGSRLAIWVRPNAMPAGARVIATWESVVVFVPEDRRARIAGGSSRDALIASARPSGFLGSKPPEWTRWVLDMLGFDPTTDTVDDIFPGSGAVSAAIDGMLPHPA